MTELTIQIRKTDAILPTWRWRLVDEDGDTIQQQPPLAIFFDRSEALASATRALTERRAAERDVHEWHDADPIPLARGGLPSGDLFAPREQPAARRDWT